jgi:hypothetical protein
MSNFEVITIGNNLLESTSNSKDASLRRIDDGAEIVNTEHTQVGYGESASGKFIRLELIFSSTASNILDLRRNVLETNEVSVLHTRGHESKISLNSEAHIHVFELSNILLLPGRISFRYLDGSQ